MKKRKIVVGASIAFLFVALAIQMVGGIGLIIEPYEVAVKPGSTITYDITISSYGTDCFNVTVIPCSCKIGWFEWTKKQLCVAARGQERILLNVTPSEEGKFEFKVEAVSIMNPGTYALSIAQIKAGVPIDCNKPDLIITKIWRVGNVIHYEVMNVGYDTAPAGWNIDLFVDSVWQWKDDPGTPLAPGERQKRFFGNYKWQCTDPSDTIKVCAVNVIGEIRKDNNCIEEVLKCNQPPTCIALMPEFAKPQPQLNGTVINWTACAFDPEGNTPWYRFLLSGPITGGNLSVVQDWSASNEWIWRTGGSDKGDNLICADVRDGYHASDSTAPDYDLSTCQWYWID